MTIDIIPLRKPKSTISNKLNLSLSEYVKLTQKIIRILVKPPLLGKILNSEDIFSNIMTEVMMADWTYKQGIGNLFGYRCKRANWAIMAYINRLKKSRTINLDPYIYFHPTYFNKDIDTVDLQEFMISMIDKKIINMMEYNCLLYKYIYEKKLIEIADIYCISKQRCHQIIRNGLFKLKKYWKDNV